MKCTFEYIVYGGFVFFSFLSSIFVPVYYFYFRCWEEEQREVALGAVKRSYENKDMTMWWRIDQPDEKKVPG
jgi:hypothetical protein